MLGRFQRLFLLFLKDCSPAAAAAATPPAAAATPAAAGMTQSYRTTLSSEPAAAAATAAVIASTPYSHDGGAKKGVGSHHISIIFSFKYPLTP